MIRKLQKRFIRIALLVLTAAMLAVVGIINTVNLISVRAELRNTLEMLTEGNVPILPEAFGEPGRTEEPGEAEAPDMPDDFGESGDHSPGSSGDRIERTKHFRNMMSESNWFSVHYSVEGKIRNQNLSHMADADESVSKELAEQALASGQSSGWIGDFCFLILNEGGRGRTVVVLNGETRMAAVRKLALISLIACAGAILLSWVLVKLFSRKAVEPTIRNMEQQKQFITNASHELKTPLTVISTNMELLKMEHPDNPWIRSTQKQTAAMRRLVDELVYLSRMEEEHPALTMESLNPGAMLKETAEPFQAMAEFNGKEMNIQTAEGLRITGDRASIQRLMSTLCDNAVKYTPEGGTILAETAAEGKHAVIRVSNTVDKPMSKEQCEQLFNRFYRAETSRSKEKQSGFGIGLAIADAIAEKHNGAMHAEMEGDRLVISAVLPREA